VPLLFDWRGTIRLWTEGRENLNVLPVLPRKAVVDPVFGACCSRSAGRPGPDVDLTQASSILEEQKRQREDKFADSWFQRRTGRHPGKKVEEGMKKAKECSGGNRFVIFDLD